MKNHATIRRKLPLASVAARFLFTAFLVFATFNPSHYSIVTWIIGGSSSLSVKAFVAFALALLWLIVFRISLAGLGWLGLAYVGLAGLVLALLHAQFGVLHQVSGYALVLAVELAIAVVLTFGLVFSYWVRQASGQSAVVKNPP